MKNKLLQRKMGNPY